MYICLNIKILLLLLSYFLINICGVDSIACQLTCINGKKIDSTLYKSSSIGYVKIFSTSTKTPSSIFQQKKKKDVYIFVYLCETRLKVSSKLMMLDMSGTSNCVRETFPKTVTGAK